ncbi:MULTISPECIES: gliding motility-associated C-terminal domain-containing protein [unclassified Carboxylicivirga]|uniref:T9SS type B sorting domain-containing protein n=1 Tax=Carboxylicivirga TaxID=1628153 RepID=UPI003D3527B5
MQIGQAIVVCILFFSFTAQGQDKVYAYDDMIKGFENRAVNIPVLNNDFGLTKGIAGFRISEPAVNGAAIIEDDNTITFIPDRSFAGKDEFIYEVCNTDGSCDEAIVFVEIEDVDFIPEAHNDTFTYLHGSVLLVDFIANDLIEGDEPISISIEGKLWQGNYILNEDNTMELSFERRFVGTDSLDYILCDADNDCSRARIMIDVRHSGDVAFYLPEGFSPNGDGINDTFFVPDFTTYRGISISIADAWGSLVYQQDDYQNDWNGVANQGRNKGQHVPAGTYYYCINIEGVSETITGFVYVAR